MVTVVFFNRGVVHFQIRCTDFKSSKKSLDFFIIFHIFGIFSNFFPVFWVYEDFMNKNGSKHWNRGVVHSQIRYTVFKSSKKILGFFGFFPDFSDFFGSVRGFFWVKNPSSLMFKLNNFENWIQCLERDEECLRNRTDVCNSPGRYRPSSAAAGSTNWRRI